MSANLEHFQDREAAIAAFDHLWDNDTPWILALTGFSGHGKTTLLDWLEAERCIPQQMPYAITGLETASKDETDRDPGIGAALHRLMVHPALRHRVTPQVWTVYTECRDRAIEDRNRRTFALTQIQTMTGSETGQQTMSANQAEALRAMAHTKKQPSPRHRRG